MSQTSLLARKPCGIPNYRLIAIFVACFAAMVPYSARQALLSNSNRAEDWLPATFSESTDLRWFRNQFASGSILVCTWDGCTLGDDQQLRLLEKKLAARVALPVTPEVETADSQPSTLNRQPATGRWFRRLLSGPGVIDELTGEPLKLGYPVAVQRLEGSLVGPRLIGPDGKPLGDASRQTCLVIYLAPEGYVNNTNMRMACEEIERVACQECGVPRESFRLAGPPADNVAIDATSRSSFRIVSALTGLMGMLLAYWCYRSIGLTGIVVVAGWLCAGAAMALVYFYGLGEMLIGGLPKPHYGTLDAVTMTMPAVIYVLGISAAVHLVNYYLDARRTLGIAGAAERAVRVGWKPCFLAALTTAIGLGSLATSHIVPIKKFGAYSAAAVMLSLAILFAILPVFLHRFPPRLRAKRSDRPNENPVFTSGTNWLQAAARWILVHNGWVTVAGLVIMLATGIGLVRLKSSVQVLKLLSPSSELIADYAWIEKNLAHVVPMEVVITIPDALCRRSDEHAETGGQGYRMTMLERLDLIRRLAARIEQLPAVSRTMSVATLGPEPSDRRAAYTINESLEANRGRLAEFLKVESMPAAAEEIPHARELWRITSRVAALKDIDYGQFVQELQEQVEPLLTVYRSREVLVRQLADAGRQLEGAQLTVLFRGPSAATEPDPNSPAGLLTRLLLESGVQNRVDGRRGEIIFRNLAAFDSPRTDATRRGELLAELGGRDAVLLMAGQDDPVARQLLAEDLPLVDLAALEPAEGLASIASSDHADPPTVRAVYTGVVPLVFKTQRQLLVSLRESMILAAVTIGLVMSLVLRNPVAGLISMIPNVFPLVLVFGILSWMGVKVDVGTMMSASVALGVAVDDTIHFLTWFRRGTTQGLDRPSAAMLAYDRCGAAMAQTTLIAGLGMAMFVVSQFMPTQRFGLMMVSSLAAALVGDLVLLPALLCGPLGRFLEVHEPAVDGPANDSQGEATDDTSPAEPAWMPLVQDAAAADDGFVPTPGAVPQAAVPESEYESPLEPQSADPVTAEVVDVEDRHAESAPQPTERRDDPQLTNSSHLELRERLSRYRRQ